MTVNRRIRIRLLIVLMAVMIGLGVYGYITRFQIANFLWYQNQCVARAFVIFLENTQSLEIHIHNNSDQQHTMTYRDADSTCEYKVPPKQEGKFKFVLKRSGFYEVYWNDELYFKREDRFNPTLECDYFPDPRVFKSNKIEAYAHGALRSSGSKKIHYEFWIDLN